MAVLRRRAVITNFLMIVMLIWFTFLLYTVIYHKELASNSSANHFSNTNRQYFDGTKNEAPERHVTASARVVHLGKDAGIAGAPVQDPLIENSFRKAYKDQKAFIVSPRAMSEPGEMGKPVRLSRNLTIKEQHLKEKGWNDHAFNLFVSDMISVHRRIQDLRTDRCRNRDWGKLPETSVVVCFHNEAWSTLLRTVHSVIDRSPAHLIKEIILVDDFSDMAHLGAPLDQYMAQYRQVKIVRTKKREGLIRARLLGTRHATGSVVTYLDSHCECTEGWLEPLLARIAHSSTTVACPVIDTINVDTFEYLYSPDSDINVGGFDWRLTFSWHPVPERVIRSQGHPSDPIESPTMAGGLFAIDRGWFETLGTYDPEFDIWGGENLELSFKTWMCGGRLEIVPCSHVGHVFRSRSPYKWKPEVNVLLRNNIRLAEVWLDDYKQIFYQRIGMERNSIQYGDVMNRKMIRNRLNCKSFKWYLDTVYPELFVPTDAVAKGEVRNNAAQVCLDGNVGKIDEEGKLSVFFCHLQEGNQFWMLTKTGEVRREDHCLDYTGVKLILYRCHGMRGNQLWTYNPDRHHLVHITNKCLTVNGNGDELLMKTCTSSDARQRWVFQNYNASKLL